MAEPRRFPIRFSSGNGILFRGLLIPPSSALWTSTTRRSMFGLAGRFSARIPRWIAAGAGLGRPPTIRFTAGAHGWGGRWLVNGAPDGIVTVDLSEPVRAFVSGFPIRLKELSVSLEDPEGFLGALGAPPR